MVNGPARPGNPGRTTPLATQLSQSDGAKTRWVARQKQNFARSCYCTDRTESFRNLPCCGSRGCCRDQERVASFFWSIAKETNPCSRMRASVSLSVSNITCNKQNNKKRPTGAHLNARGSDDVVKKRNKALERMGGQHIRISVMVPRRNTKGNFEIADEVGRGVPLFPRWSARKRDLSISSNDGTVQYLLGRKQQIQYRRKQDKIYSTPGYPT